MQTHQDQVAGRNQEHRVTYQTLGAKFLKLHDEIIENDVLQLVDFDGKPMDLFSYKYRMGAADPDPLSVLIKKGTDDHKLTSESYHRLLAIQYKHKLLIPVENFYEKGSNRNGWFIFSLVDGSLLAWLKTEGGDALFRGTGVKKDMAEPLRTMIIDIWSLLYDMAKGKVYPERIALEDFFLKMLPGGAPRIQLLLTEFRVLRKPYFTQWEEWDRCWDQIDLLIRQCCEVSNVELSESSTSFCKYARQCTSIEDMKYFPDNWTYDQKSCYLYHMISGTPFPKHVMRSKINEDSGLKWPKRIDGSNIPVITKILNLKCNNVYDNEGKWCKPKYDIRNAYGYVQVFRNHHKHFEDLPFDIKSMLGGSRKSMIRCMETWEPNIWIMLYEAVGPAGGQKP